jgi:hypothetical protein
VDRRGAGILITGIAEIRAHLDRGAPWDACDAFREAAAECPNDAELLHWGALAHARAGAMWVAHALLDRAEATAPGGALAADIASLRGRLLKDAFHRAPERAGALQTLARARQQYLMAYAVASDPHPGINAATLALLLGDRNAATTLAHEVKDCAGKHSPASIWDLATVAEAELLLGDLDAAARSYSAACALAADNAGIVATMRRQVNLLARVVPDARGLLPLLRVPDVVAFAGHMIDSKTRAVPRFPPALVPAVRAALDEHLANLHHPVVFTSAAYGADLLFIEASLARNAEVNVILPFERVDFVRTSVAIGGAEWVRRFDDALTRVTRIVMATEETHLGDDMLFDHAARLVEGFSRLRAAQLETSPAMLCVLDPDADAGTGGTGQAYERWERTFGPPQIIDLRVLREQDARTRKRVRTTDRACSMSPGEPNVAPGGIERAHRAWKSMMFSDFAGFSRVPDALAPQFQERFLKIAAAQIAEAPAKPLDAKTWGDGLYVVFDSPHEAAEFALGFLDRALGVDWTATGLASTIPIRVALHAGPVYRGFDPVMERDHFFGSSVTRAARIEPITQPGTVYASEAFAATLAASGQREFTLEYIGQLPLAKAYGEARIYRLDRA